MKIKQRTPAQHGKELDDILHESLRYLDWREDLQRHGFVGYLAWDNARQGIRQLVNTSRRYLAP
jgi:hypothetical protein